MSSVAARNVGIGERGRIEAGFFADLVLLDPEEFTDQATFEAPNELSTGVITVWVNGEIVYEDGETTKAFPGRIVSRAEAGGQ
jgi:N-acyl-D-amino-acid deacylase